ncbi:RHS repeat-associated core domain-containing protein [Chromobacterium sp. CV08]|uniref:RHS repeat-associated core domain-containing protein n=1 Tax=Chromobacterium sp. CV08 TaxID=3133274 RepID=UPI003DA9FEA8
MSDSALQFNGERSDPANWQYHLGNGYRAYSPALMRFRCPDSLSPFGAGGVDAYAYCAGDPVNRADPSGHLSWQAWTSIGLGVAGLALAAVTAGASIAASGGVIAALETASALSLAIGGAVVAADAAAIASGSLEERAPQASAILAWMSLGAGAAGGMAAIGAGALRATAGLRARLGNLLQAGLSGRGAPAALPPATATRNALGLIEQTGFAGGLYRADMRSPATIRRTGFPPSTEFRGVPDMRGAADPTLIVSETMIGALHWKQSPLGLNGAGFLYRIKAERVEGVSLLRNFPSAALSRHLLKIPSFVPVRPSLEIRTEEQLFRQTGGANILTEAHVRLSSITVADISEVTQTEIDGLLPLEPWTGAS